MAEGSAPAACVKAEVHRLTTAVRTNARWASENRFKREIPMEQESPMLRSLKTLHTALQSAEDLYALDVVAYTRPFLDVIVSEETSGTITGIALSSINKFLLYGFISPDAPRGGEAVNRIAHAATHCRFEPVSTADDEAVLSKLLEVLGNALRCAAGPALTDSAVWDMAHCAFLIARIEKGSVLLQRSAEATLSSLIMHVFARTRELADAAAEAEEAEVVETGEEEDALLAFGGSGAGERPLSRRRPYGAPVLQRLLSWLAGLTDPRSHGRHTRVLGMELINIVLETGGAALGDMPGVVSVVQAEVCKFLIANSRTSDLPVLALALRVVFNLFAGLKRHLKVQLEVFLTSVHLYLADSSAAAPEQRELALESLLEFTREPDMMLDLYANFDCDVACTNLYEAVVRCLCRNAVPERGAPLTSLHACALEGVLAILASMARRCPGHPDFRKQQEGWDRREGEGGTGLDTSFARGDEKDTSTAAVLRARRALKSRMGLVAARFAAEPKTWVEYAQELGLLPSPADAKAVAQFLRDCPGLDRTAIGLYLSEPDDARHTFNTAVRAAYCDSFHFAGMRIDDALRVFLESFRLPGEAQKIERLMAAFAERLYAASPGGMHHSDTAFVLAYSIIMLNTDLHNKQVRHKMTREQFTRNNRGIDASGADLPPEYLHAIFESIAAREIHMKADAPTMHGGAGAGEGAGDGAGGKGGAGGDSAAGAPSRSSRRAEGAEGDASRVLGGAAWDGILSRQASVSAYTSVRGSATPAPKAAGVGGALEGGTPKKRGPTPAATPQPQRLAFPAQEPSSPARAMTGRGPSPSPSPDPSDPERDMFALVADPALAVLSTVYGSTRDPAVLKRAAAGFRDCAVLAWHYGLSGPLNSLAVSLCGLVVSDMDGLGELVDREREGHERGEGGSSALLTYARAVSAAYVRAVRPADFGPLPGPAGGEGGDGSTTPSTPLLPSMTALLGEGEEGEGRPRAVSGGEEEVGGGRSRLGTAGTLSGLTSSSPHPHPSLLSSCPAAFVLRRLLLALRVLLGVTAKHAPVLVEAWVNIVDVITRLAINDVLPPEVFTPEDFRAPDGSAMPSVASGGRGGMDEGGLGVWEGVRGGGWGRAAPKPGPRSLVGRQEDKGAPAPESDPVSSLPALLSGSRHLRELLARHDEGVAARARAAAAGVGGEGEGAEKGGAVTAPAPPSTSGLWGTLSALFGGGRGEGGEGPDVDPVGDAVLAAVASEVARTGALPALLASTPSLPAPSLTALMSAIVTARTPAQVSTALGGGGDDMHDLIVCAFLGELGAGVATRNAARASLVLPPLLFLQEVLCAGAGAGLGRSQPAPAPLPTSEGGGAGGTVRWWAPTLPPHSDLRARACLYVAERVGVNALRMGGAALAAGGRGGEGGTPSTPLALPASPSTAPLSASAVATACLRHALRTLPLPALPALAPRLAAGLGALLQLGLGDAGEAEAAGAALDVMEACQPFFFAAPGVWDCLVGLVGSGGAAVGPHHSRLLRALLCYTDAHTGDAAVCGLAAALLMADAEGGASGGLAGRVRRARASTDRGRPTEPYAPRLVSCATGEPVSELREFGAAAVCRLMDGLAGEGVEGWVRTQAALAVACAHAASPRRPATCPSPLDEWEGALGGEGALMGTTCAGRRGGPGEEGPALRCAPAVSRILLTAFARIASHPPEGASPLTWAEWGAASARAGGRLQEWAFATALGPLRPLLGPGVLPGTEGAATAPPSPGPSPALAFVTTLRAAVDRQLEADGGEGPVLGGEGPDDAPPTPRALSLAAAELCAEADGLAVKTFLAAVSARPALVSTPGFATAWLGLVRTLVLRVRVMEGLAGEGGAVALGVPPAALPMLLAHAMGAEAEAARSLISESASAALARLLLLLGTAGPQGSPDALTEAGEAEGRDLWGETWAVIEGQGVSPGLAAACRALHAVPAQAAAPSPARVAAPPLPVTAAPTLPQPVASSPVAAVHTQRELSFAPAAAETETAVVSVSLTAFVGDGPSPPPPAGEGTVEAGKEATEGGAVVQAVVPAPLTAAAPAEPYRAFIEPPPHLRLSPSPMPSPLPVRPSGSWRGWLLSALVGEGEEGDAQPSPADSAAAGTPEGWQESGAASASAEAPGEPLLPAAPSAAAGLLDMSHGSGVGSPDRPLARRTV